jgi:protein-S-isoprenylcysteine O-methyltransferase Ste14
LDWTKICNVEITAQRLCQIETERHMSFFQPTSSNPTEASAMPAPMIELKGRLADINFVPAITGGVLALAISRIGGDAIVQDLHAGATGVLVLFASLVVYFALNTVLKRDEAKPYRTTGIFSFSRNPAYLAFFLPLAALAYFDVTTAIAATVIYVLAMNLLVIQKQESELQATFGEGFTAYRSATPRWFA